MTTVEMVTFVKAWTKHPDDTKILIALRSGYRWTVKRVYNSEGGPNLLSTIGRELAIASTTRDYDLSAAIVTAGGGELLGIKKLWLKLPSDQNFTPMNETDAETPVFQSYDAELAASPTIASGHPVMYQVVNYDKVRFAPALPAGSTLRVDYFRVAPPPDPTTNNTAETALDLPAIFHDAMVSKAIAHMFNMLDDTREGTWETRARDEVNDAIFTAGKRVQQPTRTTPWRRGRRRVL
jgi:hypothetical protein